MVGTSMAEGSGVGGSEAMVRGRRIVHPGQEYGTSSQRDGDSPKEAGSLPAKPARDAPQSSLARPVDDAYRSGQVQGGAGCRLCESETSGQGRAGDERNFFLCFRQGKTTQGGIAGWALSIAVERNFRRSGRLVGAVCAVDGNRGGVQMPQERSSDPSHLSSAR